MRKERSLHVLRTNCNCFIYKTKKRHSHLWGNQPELSLRLGLTKIWLKKIIDFEHDQANHKSSRRWEATCSFEWSCVDTNRHGWCLKTQNYNLCQRTAFYTSSVYPTTISRGLNISDLWCALGSTNKCLPVLFATAIFVSLSTFNSPQPDGSDWPPWALLLLLMFAQGFSLFNSVVSWTELVDPASAAYPQ